MMYLSRTCDKRKKWQPTHAMNTALVFGNNRLNFPNKVTKFYPGSWQQTEIGQIIRCKINPAEVA